LVDCADEKSMDAKNSVTVMEMAHATEMQEDLRRKLKEASHEDGGGRIDSVRATVLSKVAAENYEYAMTDLQDYVAQKNSYSEFQTRVERYVQHCIDLIQAIETKRNFPGLASLTLSKQQELHEKVLEHFEELKHNLKHIEKVERDHKLSDVRTTVWVLKTLSYTVGAILAAAFILDLRSGMLSSITSVSSDLLNSTSTWIVQHIPFL
jgi:hypothetical protein